MTHKDWVRIPCPACNGKSAEAGQEADCVACEGIGIGHVSLANLTAPEQPGPEPGEVPALMEALAIEKERLEREAEQQAAEVKCLPAPVPKALQFPTAGTPDPEPMSWENYWGGYGGAP